MTQPYIELDHAGFGQWPRLTHIPSGDTCLRAPYMTNREWLDKKQEFLNKYPELIILDEGQEADRANVMET